MSEDVHHNKAALERIMGRIKDAEPERISKEDKKLLQEFEDYCHSKNLSTPRIRFYMTNLWKITEWKSKDFDQMGRGQVQSLVSKINQKQYSAHTKKDYRITIKKFFQWLNGDPDSEVYPEEVDWITTTLEHNGKKLPEEILSKDDIKAMLRCTKTSRDKALVSMLYESGCRIGELLPLKWKHLDFSVEEGVKLTVSGKTGSRKLLLVSSAPHLLEWKANYPGEIKRDNRVWVSVESKGGRGAGKPLGYRAIRKQLKRIAKRAEVTKDVNPHAFRHARATHLANHLTEAQMCEYFGWVQGSDQPATYVHLSGRDVDNAIKELHGLKEREEEKDEFDIRKCPECGHENTPELSSCEECGYTFGESRTEKMMENIKENPEEWGEVFLNAMKKAEEN